MMQVTKDFFDMPIEEKASYCSEIQAKSLDSSQVKSSIFKSFIYGGIAWDLFSIRLIMDSGTHILKSRADSGNSTET